MKTCKSLVLIISIFCSAFIFAEGKYRFATGFQGGTYYHIGNSLNSLKGYKVTVLTTRGSVQNIKLVSDKKADLGLTQMDILIKKALKSKKMRKTVKIILPLFNEEVHILSKRSIKTIKDLAGKRVNIGPSGSGIRATSKIILEKMGIKGKKKVSINKSKTMNALMKLIGKEIDAVFIVAGAPVEILAGLPPQANARLHLMPISDAVYKKLTKTFPYRRATIRKSTYRWMTSDVKTVSVTSAIIARNNISNEEVATLLKDIMNNKSILASKHKKWLELNKENIKSYLKKYKKYFHLAAISYLEAI